MVREGEGRGETGREIEPRTDVAREELQIGRPLTVRDATGVREARSVSVRRVLVATVAVVVGLGVVAAATLAGYRLRDVRETYTQEQLTTAVATFRPDIAADDTAGQSAEELRPDQPVQTRPVDCVALITVSPTGALGGASWSAASTGDQDVELQAVRFTDPDRARAVFRALRGAARSCHHVALSADATGPAGAGFDVVARDVPTSLRHRDEVAYTMRWADAADQGESGYREFEIYLRQIGNVLVWAIGPAAADGLHRRAADDLTARLRQLGHR